MFFESEIAMLPYMPVAFKKINNCILTNKYKNITKC